MTNVGAPPARARTATSGVKRLPLEAGGSADGACAGARGPPGARRGHLAGPASCARFAGFPWVWGVLCPLLFAAGLLCPWASPRQGTGQCHGLRAPLTVMRFAAVCNAQGLLLCRRVAHVGAQPVLLSQPCGHVLARSPPARRRPTLLGVSTGHSGLPEGQPCSRPRRAGGSGSVCQSSTESFLWFEINGKE